MASPRQIANDLRARAALVARSGQDGLHVSLTRGARALDEALSRVAELEAELARRRAFEQELLDLGRVLPPEDAP